MFINVKKITGFVRSSIPLLNQTLATDVPELLEDENIVNSIREVYIYYRNKDKCQFGRGNWICDIDMGGYIICIKLPKETEKAQVLKYFKPLIDLLNARKDNIYVD